MCTDRARRALGTPAPLPIEASAPAPRFRSPSSAIPTLCCRVYDLPVFTIALLFAIEFLCADDEGVRLLLSVSFGLDKFLIERFELLPILLFQSAGNAALFLHGPFFLTQLGLQQRELGLELRAHLFGFLRDGRFVLVRRRL